MRPQFSRNLHLVRVPFMPCKYVAPASHQMKVIAHQAIGMHLPAGLFASLAQRLQESVAVLVVRENRLAAIAPVQDVVHGPGIRDAQLASHARIVQKTNLSVNAI